MTIDLKYKLLTKTLEGAHDKLDNLSSEELLGLVNQDKEMNALYNEVFSDKKY